MILTRGKYGWPKDMVSRKILPPIATLMQGCPKKKRRRGKLEGILVQIRRCRGVGHNKSTVLKWYQILTTT
ncbi:hypothetical protein FRX31_009577 [Thalictrum thalictroides]|uniref:Uncharacterized protein n=1 Tax=Thalictrum thalictroides TaxID=46969 RepID=A0A7J6WTU8_THATH|nr:hypothetical protein FRX31_009577 [Thalictrum thalictroides]